MLVYGDHVEQADPARHLRAIAEELGQLPGQGLARHQRLVGALVESGRVLQGLADAGVDARLEPFLIGLGQAVCRSWQQGFAGPVPLPSFPELPPLPASVELRLPEGYAFYALYPEAYALAAARLRLSAPPRVIGIRSIGTSLAAIVAAALDAETFFTVRPEGDPFDRRMSVSRSVEAALLRGEAHFVVVDEGPGQSGSSFGAVANWLQERGVPLGRIAFMPSHTGAPGPQASPAHRERWTLAQRPVADLGAEFPDVLAIWTAELLGPLDGPLVELSGGAWRHYLLPEEDWPAVNPMWERRKFLAQAGGETWLLKFAGLGASGERKLELARRLHSDGWAAEPRGLVHGFLVERWHADARPLRRGEVPLERVAAYLSSRVDFRAPESSGASIEQLLTMARRNTALALGESVSRQLARWEPRIADLSARVRRVRTDNRMLAHEWLRLPRGELIKADALDHHAAHDLIGCQDLAWDVAGAAVELGLDHAELAARISPAVDRELLEFLIDAYLAFRLGQSALSAQMTDAEEQALHRATADGYAEALGSRLSARKTEATQQEPWISLQAE